MFLHGCGPKIGCGPITAGRVHDLTCSCMVVDPRLAVDLPWPITAGRVHDLTCSCMVVDPRLAVDLPWPITAGCVHDLTCSCMVVDPRLAAGIRSTHDITGSYKKKWLDNTVSCKILQPHG